MTKLKRTQYDSKDIGHSALGQVEQHNFGKGFLASYKVKYTPTCGYGNFIFRDLLKRNGKKSP